MEEMQASMERAKAEGADLVELCLDSLPFSHISEVQKLIKQRTLPAIVSFRCLPPLFTFTVLVVFFVFHLHSPKLLHVYIHIYMYIYIDFTMQNKETQCLHMFLARLLLWI
jgi:hypothetical protein